MLNFLALLRSHPFWIGFWTLVDKERRHLMASTIAIMVFTVFLAVLLFYFFWGSGWFSRNLADMRPMFESLPLLLIFLASAMTMKSWSEEKQSGTLEFLCTLPQPIGLMVLAKFLAQLQWLTIALMLSLPLPLSLHFAVTPLDWGPIIGGYIATLFLGATYLAIGQYASARSNNPITALLWAVTLGIFFYLIGSPQLTDFFDAPTSSLLRSYGTLSRFTSIARGVLDFRDVAYYLSLTGFFLLLSIARIAREGMSTLPSPYSPSWYRQRSSWILMLVAANLLLIHAWLIPWGNALRIDLTKDRRFSLSPITLKTLNHLGTPVLIRGYFSKKTHPLLAPLQSEIMDRLQDMAIYQPQRLIVESLDPSTSPEQEEEAITRYHIRPLPFRINDRYQASVVSAYFHVVVQVGDQYQVLSVRDLLDIKISPSGQTEIVLRNLEYELLRAIRHGQAAFGEDDRLSNPIAFLPPINVGEDAPPELAAAMSSGILQFDLLKKSLEENHSVETIQHTNALASKNYSAIILAAPRQLPNSAAQDLTLFQQKGGHIVLLTSPFQPLLTTTSLGLQEIRSGLEPWLMERGIRLEPTLVLDSQNMAFPTMTSRQLSNGYAVPEMLLAPYPYFVAIQPNINPVLTSPSTLLGTRLTQGISSLTVPWSSPINVDDKVLPSSYQAMNLLQSSPHSWLSAATDIVPTIDEKGVSGFIPNGPQNSHLLAIALMPRHQALKTSGSLVVVGSNAFASDGIANLNSMVSGQTSRGETYWLQNLVDSLLGEEDLLAIRARTSLGKNLPHLSSLQKSVVEWSNYGFALLGILLLLGLTRWRYRQRHRAYAALFHRETL